MEKVKEFVEKYKYPLSIALCVIIAIAGYVIWQKHHTQTITTERERERKKNDAPSVILLLFVSGLVTPLQLGPRLPPCTSHASLFTSHL